MNEFMLRRHHFSRSFLMIVEARSFRARLLSTKRTSCKHLQVLKTRSFYGIVCVYRFVVISDLFDAF